MYDAIGLKIKRTNNGNVWCLRDDLNLFTEFSKSNFDKPDEITLVNAIYFQKSNGDWIQIFDDLRAIARKYYGVKHQVVHIYKDQAFCKSRLEKECIEVYRPFLMMLQDDKTLHSICNGSSFVINGKTMKIDPVDISKIDRI
jgi:prophage tail gpP-like protein